MGECSRLGHGWDPADSEACMRLHPLAKLTTHHARGRSRSNDGGRRGNHQELGEADVAERVSSAFELHTGACRGLELRRTTMPPTTAGPDAGERGGRTCTPRPAGRPSRRPSPCTWYAMTVANSTASSLAFGFASRDEGAPQQDPGSWVSGKAWASSSEVREDGRPQQWAPPRHESPITTDRKSVV